MPQTDDILAAALQLPDSDRMHVAVELLGSLSPDHSDVSDDEWPTELRRRRDEYLADPSAGVPWEDLKDDGEVKRPES